MILIVGNYDAHSKKIYDKIQSRNQKVILIDSNSFFSQFSLGIDPTNYANGLLNNFKTNEKIDISTIKSVYWYTYSGFSIPQNMNTTDSFYYIQELESSFGSFILNLDCLWVNHPKTIFHHKFKINQLKQIKELGVKVPASIVTNNVDCLYEFFEKHNKKILRKPLFWGVPQILEEKEFNNKSYIQELVSFPAIYQEYITGRDIRVHIVNQEMFVSEIISAKDIFKTDQNLKIYPYEISLKAQEDSLKIAASLDLVLAGIDFRITPDEDYVFFEANPSPQFLMYEEYQKIPISNKLVDLLCK